jgi:hypothetical protein
MAGMLAKRFLVRIALAVLLGVGQQAAALHELSHRVEDIHASHGKGAAHADACERCLAFAGFSAILASASLTPADFAAAPRAVPLWKATPHSVALLAAYLSRAPPPIS